MFKEECADGYEVEERKDPFPKREGQRTLGISQRKEERSTLEEGSALTMGYFVGPIGVYIPDSQRDLVYSAALSAGMAGATRIALNIATTQEIAKMASHHLPTNYVRGQLVSASVRRQAGRQVGKWTVGRGLALAAGASPVGWALTAAVILSSIPSDVRDPVTGLSSYQAYQAEQASKWYMTGEHLPGA